MLFDLLRPLLCLFWHRYEAGRFFDPNLQMWRAGERCTGCRKTKLD
jgi:hypothetical protein